MERLHAPNEFFRIRRLREGMRTWRLLADGPHRLASEEGDDGAGGSCGWESTIVQDGVRRCA